MNVKFEQLLGLRFDDKRIAAVLNAFGSTPKLEIAEDGYYFCAFGQGIEFKFDADVRLVAVFFHPGNGAEIAEFQGKLPCGITFSEDISSVKRLLGSPSENGGGEHVLGRWIDPWDKYCCDKYDLHISYSKNRNRIMTITVISKEWKPGMA